MVKAPTGTELSCKGWQQEAALRMLMNNLDPDVAEDPENLIVYGGTGKAARNWEAYDAIVRSLRSLHLRMIAHPLPCRAPAHRLPDDERWLHYHLKLAKPS